MEFSISAAAPRLTHMVHALTTAFPVAATVATQREMLADAGRHVRGKAVLVLPGEGCCPVTGQPLNATAAGDALRLQLDGLRADGVRVTVPLLTEHHQQMMDLQTQHLRTLTMKAVLERGVGVPAGWQWNKAQIVDHAPAQQIWLVQREYRYDYSRRAGSWWVGAAYLTGIEDSQAWVERVSRHITTVAEATAAITPAAVHRAHTEGRQVLRQGDVWLVELHRGQDNFSALPSSHDFDAARRVLSHLQHGELHVPFRARAYTNLNVAGSWGD